jgi:carboxypeptidase Q
MNKPRAWRERIAIPATTPVHPARALEEAGAAGIVMSNWSQGFGTNKVFGANTRNHPHHRYSA